MTNHTWGFYCEDRSNSRVLVIETHRLYDDPDITVDHLKQKFNEFMRQFERDYTVSDDFYYLAVNIYR